MKEQFSFLYHHNSKSVSVPPQEQWPEAWKAVQYKTYPRLPGTMLPSPALAPIQIKTPGIFDILKERRSRRNFTGGTVSLDECSTLLKYGMGIVCREDEGASRPRSYPSAGGLYPIETYILCALPPAPLIKGVYHYGVKNHSVSRIRLFGDDEHLADFFVEPWVDNAAMVIVLTAVFERSYQKYKERAYRFILQEAGHIMQNVYLVSEVMGIKCCSLEKARTSDSYLENILDIDGNEESMIAMIAVGR